jgi:hypothetical protein
MTNRIFLALLVTLGACGDDHPIGAIERDSGPDTPPAASQDAAVADPGPVRQDAAPTIGFDTAPTGPLGPTQSWTGWTENYQYKSGSDVVRLSFASDPNGVVVGQVTLGAGTPPPPATDPNVGYPEGSITNYSDVSLGIRYTVLEGFSYTMYEGIVTKNRLRFTIQPNEPWTGWCALQTPAVDGSGSCLPNWSMTSDPDKDCYLIDATSGALVSIDCGKLNLCFNHYCLCSTTSCRLKLPTDPFIPGDPTQLADELALHFDMALTGDIAAGSMGSTAIRLTKDP